MSRALYVHIPFCASICSYCDFCRVFYNKTLADQYLDALEKESQSVKDTDFLTIYIGGGTPTSLSEKQLERLLQILKPFTQRVKEYTIEINPETFNNKKAELLKEYGVNRASIGIQTFDTDLLKLINRKHTNQDVEQTIEILRRTGIDNISVDLMHGLPEQSVQMFTDSLEKCIGLKVPHISFYGLTIEENSVFGKNGIEPQCTEISDQQYFEGLRILEENNYHQYEISNFAKPGFESKHNQVYWNYQDFTALGCGASGKENHIRYTNTRSIKEYINGKTKDEIIELSKEDELFETLMMGLRLKDGFIPSQELLDYYRSILSECIEEGILCLENGVLKANEKAYYVLNDILVRFL